MRVIGAFKVFNADCYDVESTSSSGWEYFVVWEDLGSSPMYAIFMLFNLWISMLYIWMWDVIT